MYIHLSRGKKHLICTDSLESKKIWDSLLSSPNRVSVLFQIIFLLFLTDRKGNIEFQEFYKIMVQEEIYIYGDLPMVKLLIVFPFTWRERFSLQDFTPLERLWPQQDLIDWFVSLFISTGDKCFVVIIIIHIIDHGLWLSGQERSWSH